MDMIVIVVADIRVVSQMVVIVVVIITIIICIACDKALASA